MGSLRRAASPRAKSEAMPCASDQTWSATMRAGGRPFSGSVAVSASAAWRGIAKAWSAARASSGSASGGSWDSNMAA